MYCLFFNNRRIAVCSNNDNSPKEPTAVQYIPENNQGIEELPFIFVNLSNVNWLSIITSDEDATFDQLCKKLTRINAGGGVVTNDNGEILLIYRNGHWDLPKGKQEKGESIESTAVREVEEECGISNLQLKDIICKTYHTYVNKEGELTVKSTYWYQMEYHGKDQTTRPQTEENIEQAIWVKPSELSDYLSNTYLSILEVFSVAQIFLSPTNSVRYK
jgi:8-oxo-dGTP pyrophosphatase MutT (NUDIX family)